MKKTGRIFIIALVIMCFALLSCKKSPTSDPAPPQPDPDPTITDTDTVSPTPGSDDPSPSTPDSPDANADMVALNIELPIAAFKGTPIPILVDNLEPPLGHDREPFLAPKGTVLISRNKTVLSEDPIFGELSLVTDGDKEAADGCFVYLGPLKQEIVIDLEAMHEIYAIIVWHNHQKAFVYFDVIAQIGEDLDFVKSTIVFNNDIDNSSQMGVGTDKHYIETAEGKLIDCKGVRGRYVKMVSRGNNANDLNHYTEVEVWGKPVE